MRSVQDDEWRKSMDIMMQEVLEQLKELQKGNLEPQMGSPERGEGGASHFSGNKTEKTEWRWRNLELPMFNGGDVAGWVDKIERYFQLKGVLEEE